MGKTGAQRRAMRGVLNLYGDRTSLGWPVIGHTDLCTGAEKAATGLWEPVYYDGSGDLAGYHVLAKAKIDSDLPSRDFSPATITFRESELNAAGLKESRTARMFESEKVRLAEPEDEVERAVAKVAQWPLPASRIDDGRGKPKFGDRAVRVYPKAM